MNPRDTLRQSLRQRLSTQLVAATILRLGLDLPAGLQLELAQLSPAWSWAASDFDRPVPAERQAQTFARLFPNLSVSDDVAFEPAGLRDLAQQGLRELLVTPDPFAADTAQAANAGQLTAERVLAATSQLRVHLPRAKRKRLRFLARLERRADALEGSLRLRRAQMQAKSRLAYAINPDALDDLTLAYVAYLTARANRRSEFLIGPQSRAQDTITEALHGMLENNPDAAWEQVVLVHPTPADIARLDQETRGRLIGVFHEALTEWALELERLYGTLPQRMRAEMVMVKGVDSSRWNAFAGAFNMMRSAWIAATVAAGLQGTFDRYLPGKAPRLMASDLAWWYRRSGQDLHEDTTLFAALPKPWDVVAGRAQLSAPIIAERAAQHGVDVSTGWTGPRASVIVERPEPDPTLVHGIAVADPVLARTLRRCGVFSSKGIRHEDELPDDLVRGETIGPDGRVRVPVLAGYKLRDQSAVR